ncbi:hypothetical protein WICMUC_004010 [Wickerhamomyces mucosus]|uniref:Cytochrome b5 heme-binding domain-containing protein n=1 Tax=Wickerhamomyces mucosus TaxID=1378264 RepID=A0A9P8PID4_9ASCO|nr:hypothetical protein WICMUC_004010 [Wickerhamomyces mucosus]
MIIYDQVSDIFKLRKPRDDKKASKIRSSSNTGDQNSFKPQVYTLDEIAKHNTAQDVWMIIHNKVYDITSIIEQHPGGPEVLLDFAGMDGTVSFDDVGHSQDSVEMLTPLFLGVVAKDTHNEGSQKDTLEDREQILMNTNDEDDDENLGLGFRYFNTLGAASEKNNSSLGQSSYWKRYSQKRKESQKKPHLLSSFCFKEKDINRLLSIIAIFALIGLIYLQKRKWGEDF